MGRDEEAGGQGEGKFHDLVRLEVGIVRLVSRLEHETSCSSPPTHIMFFTCTFFAFVFSFFHSTGAMITYMVIFTYIPMWCQWQMEHPVYIEITHVGKSQRTKIRVLPHITHRTISTMFNNTIH